MSFCAPFFFSITTSLVIVMSEWHFCSNELSADNKKKRHFMIINNEELHRFYQCSSFSVHILHSHEN